MPDLKLRHAIFGQLVHQRASHQVTEEVIQLAGGLLITCLCPLRAPEQRENLDPLSEGRRGRSAGRLLLERAAPPERVGELL